MGILDRVERARQILDLLDRLDRFSPRGTAQIDPDLHAPYLLALQHLLRPDRQAELALQREFSSGFQRLALHTRAKSENSLTIYSAPKNAPKS